MAFDWKELLTKVAPVIGGSVGGPLGSVGVSWLASKLTGEDVSNQEQAEQILTNHLSSATPETLAEIKKLDLEFEKSMKELDVEIFKDITKDRMNARAEHKDSKMPATIWIVLTLMLGGIIAGLLFVEIPETNESVLFMIVGQVVTGWVASTAYFVGTTAGSALKNKWASITGGNAK